MIRLLAVLALSSTAVAAAPIAGFGVDRFGQSDGGFVGVGLRPAFSASFSSSVTPEKGPSASFTRATGSTKYDPTTNLVTTVASGAAVISRPLVSGAIDTSGPAGVYVGAATTFVLLRNEGLANGSSIGAGWAQSGTLLFDDDVDIAPDGNQTADSVTDDDGAGQERMYQDFTVTNDSTTWTLTVWARCTTPHTFSTAIQFLGGTGTITVADHSCTTTWKRFTQSVANNGTGNTLLRAFLYPVEDVNANTGTAYFWRPELYNKAHAVSLDPATVGSSVTVNADNLQYASFSGPGDNGSYVVWMHPDVVVSTQSLVLLDGTHNLRFDMVAGTMRFSTDGLADTGSDRITETVSANTWTHGAVAWSQAASDIRIYKNATLGTDASADRTWSAGGDYAGDLKIGEAAVLNAQLNGHLSRVAIYSKTLTASQIAAVYNSQSATYAAAPRNPRRDWLYAALGRGPVADAIGEALVIRTDDQVVADARAWVNHPSFPKPVFLLPEGT